MKTETIDKMKGEDVSLESKDDFKPGATIAVLTLLIAFVASSVYILITGYLNIT
jgi:hypothetical protein